MTRPLSSGMCHYDFRAEHPPARPGTSRSGGVSHPAAAAPNRPAEDSGTALPTGFTVESRSASAGLRNSQGGGEVRDVQPAPGVPVLAGAESRRHSGPLTLPTRQEGSRAPYSGWAPVTAGHSFPWRRIILTVVGLLACAGMPTAAIARLTIGPLATWALFGLLFVAVGCLMASARGRPGVAR